MAKQARIIREQEMPIITRALAVIATNHVEFSQYAVVANSALPAERNKKPRIIENRLPILFSKLPTKGDDSTKVRGYDASKNPTMLELRDLWCSLTKLGSIVDKHSLYWQAPTKQISIKINVLFFSCVSASSLL